MIQLACGLWRFVKNSCGLLNLSVDLHKSGCRFKLINLSGIERMIVIASSCSGCLLFRFFEIYEMTNSFFYEDKTIFAMNKEKKFMIQWRAS